MTKSGGVAVMLAMTHNCLSNTLFPILVLLSSFLKEKFTTTVNGIVFKDLGLAWCT